MPAFKTEGVILKRRDFGEADRILTIFTQKEGKITVLARGVRKITSRRAGNIELLNRVTLFLYPGKNFLILTEAESLDTYPKLKENLTLSATAFHIIELVDRLTAENQENRVLFSHLVEVLKRLSSNPRQIWVRAFEVKALSNLGFASFITNGVNLTHPKGVQRVLENLEVMGWNEIEKIEVKPEVGMELEKILGYYLERVIEGKLRSREILKEKKR